MAGLAVGLMLATLWGVMLMRDLLPAGYRVGVSVMALRALGGAVLGGCLGVAQAWALRRAYPGLSSPRWVGATAAGGYLAALAGMVVHGLLALQFGDQAGLGALLAGFALSGLAGGLLHGLAQGWALDGVAARRATWVWFVALGWVLATVFGSLWWAFGLAGYGSMTIGAVFGGALEGLAIGLVTLRAFPLIPPLTAPPLPR
jgi:hypothetical protein